MPRDINYDQKMKQKRGKIELESPEKYIPWIMAKECYGGDGTRHQIPDLYYIKRHIHLMSDLEKDVYYTLRSKENVIELFEQFPLLPLSVTEDLCDKYEIKHSSHPKTKNNIVMTTDFLLIIDNKGTKEWLACAVKPSSKLEDKRTKEKLFIEKKYWESMGVKWCVVTEKNVDKNYVDNVILCRSGYVGIGNKSISDILKYLIVNKKINVDMKESIDLDQLIQKVKKGDITIGTDIYNGKRQIDYRDRFMVDFFEN